MKVFSMSDPSPCIPVSLHAIIRNKRMRMTVKMHSHMMRRMTFHTSVIISFILIKPALVHGWCVSSESPMSRASALSCPRAPGEGSEQPLFELKSAAVIDKAATLVDHAIAVKLQLALSDGGLSVKLPAVRLIARKWAHDTDEGAQCDAGHCHGRCAHLLRLVQLSRWIGLRYSMHGGRRAAERTMTDPPLFPRGLSGVHRAREKDCMRLALCFTLAA